MKTPQDLGIPVTLRIWHDNNGKDLRAGWYCSKVVIVDLQQQEWLVSISTIHTVPAHREVIDRLKTVTFHHLKSSLTIEDLHNSLDDAGLHVLSMG